MMQEPLTLNEFPSANVNKSTSFPSHSYMKDFSQLLRSTGGKKKNSNQTKVAAIFTSATIALLAIVALVVHSVRLYHTRNGTGNGTGTGTNVNYRFLENDENDYSQYMCDDIFIYTESNSEARCYFAQSCNSSQGLFASFIFCNTWNLSLSTWCYILTPLFTIWLVILFRMLGSTAEEFFSPSLEMFSMKMGLPPRFAGVTLLALGNGAADVSATISAIAQNPQEGYQMSLGALTGAGMFVGTVVAGVVIVIADGVKCRGALVRDLGMFVITLAVVYAIFDRGEIGVGAIHIFFWLYLGFVVVVLVADIYHRAVVLPRIRNEQSEVMAEEDEAASEERESAAAAAAASSPEQRVQFDLNTFDGNMSSTAGIELATARTSSTDVFHTPLNSGLEENDTFQDNAGMDHNSPTPPLRSEKTMNSKSTKKRGTFRRGFDRFMVAFSNYGPNEGMTDVNPANEQANNTGWSGGLEVNGERNDEHVRLHGARGLLTRRASVEEEEEQQDGDQRGQREFTAATSYRALMEGVDNMCTIDGSLSSGMGVSWGNAFATAKQEIGAHFSDYNDDIWENGENSVFDKFFMTLELPFTIMRKLSVPIPCDDYYCRGIVAASTALSPVWIGIYAMLQHDKNLFMFGGFPYIEIFTFFSSIIGLFLIKFAPSEGVDMSLAVSVPLACVGFIIAATWIDAIADQLVKLLTLLGVICRIPGAIMGLTVLAWGNSMGDLSANMTMAKKGLANMAITACFAGPVFNILIGLGGGFAKLNASTGQASTEVVLTPSIIVGLCFLAVNCLLVVVSGLVVNSGHIPKGYGYVALGLYIIYVFTSIALQFYDPDQEE